MTIEKKEDFEKHLQEAILKDKWFEDLMVTVKALDQLSDPSHPNDVRFEVHVVINGSVEDLPARDE